MQELLQAFGLQTQEVVVSPAQCRNLLPIETAQPADLVRALANRTDPPIVCDCAADGFTAICGTHLLSAACASDVGEVAGYAIVGPLAPGVVEFLVAVGRLYAGDSLHPVLEAQTLWLTYFWCNAQAAYEQRRQDTPLSPLVAPLVLTTAARDIDDLSVAIETYMATYFIPVEEYAVAGPRRVLVSWAQVLAYFPTPPSETKRKVLLRLLDSIPPVRRAAFRRVDGTLSVIRRLAGLPPEIQERVLAILAQAPPERHREILQQVGAAGMAGPRIPSGVALPQDAYPVEPVSKDGLPTDAFHAILRGLNRVNVQMQGLPKGVRLTKKQEQQLWQTISQQWNLLDALLQHEQPDSE